MASKKLLKERFKNETLEEDKSNKDGETACKKLKRSCSSCICSQAHTLNYVDKAEKEDELSEFHYKVSVNEDGWICGVCDRKIGACSNLDELLCFIKIDCILQCMSDTKLVSVSNSSESTKITDYVADACFDSEYHDFSQSFIVYKIAEYAHFH